MQFWPWAASGASSCSSGLEQALRSMNAAAGHGSSSTGLGPVQAFSSSGAGLLPLLRLLALCRPLRLLQVLALQAFAELMYLALSRPCALWRRFLLRLLLMASGVESALQRHAAGVSEALAGGERSEMTLHNPWNLFQHENRGKGWSPAKMSAMYKKWRSSEKDKMP